MICASLRGRADADAAALTLTGEEAFMFTGIVQDIGEVVSLQQRGGDARLRVRVQSLDLARQRLGDSIAVAGVCLTVAAADADVFDADISQETLALTTLGQLRAGSRVNLEPALRAADPLGGHLVIGHIDGVAELRARRADARSERMQLRVPHPLARYVARKGSVTLDGVSLTVNGVEGDDFDVNLIPHTLAVTTLGALRVGERVNFEADLIARYAERLLAGGE
jgi:riboflavin synthase